MSAPILLSAASIICSFAAIILIALYYKRSCEDQEKITAHCEKWIAEQDKYIAYQKEYIKKLYALYEDALISKSTEP